MTHVKFNPGPVNRYFNNMVDELFNDLPVLVNEGFQTRNRKSDVPVNILETKDGYELEMSVPGFEKKDIKVSVDDNILTISGETKPREAKENEKQIRKEFDLKNFKRSFTIDDKIDATGIGASYINGILTLNLPRKEEVKKAATEINIK